MMALFYSVAPVCTPFAKGILRFGMFAILLAVLTSCGKKPSDAPEPQLKSRNVVAIAKPSQTVLNVKPVVDSRQPDWIGFGWDNVTIATANFQGKFERRQANTYNPDVFMLITQDAVDFVEPTNDQTGYLIVKDSKLPYAVITTQIPNGNLETISRTNDAKDYVKRLELYAEEGTKISTNLNQRLCLGFTMKEIFVNKIDKNTQEITVGTTYTILRSTSGYAVLDLVEIPD